MDVGVMLKPLKSVEDLQRLTELMKMIPNKVSDRYTHLTKLLNTCNENRKYTLTEVSSLVQTLEDILPRFGDAPLDINKERVERECKTYMENGNFGVGIVNIIPPFTSCCGTLKQNSYKYITVYRHNRKPVVGVAIETKCNKCHTVFKTSSYKKNGKECYYKNVSELQYFQSSVDSAFEKRLMESFDIDIFRKAASFESLAYAYNDAHIGSDWMTQDKSDAILDRRRLAEAWYKRALIIMLERYALKQSIEVIRSDRLDEILEENVELLWQQFTKEWSGDRHTDNCGNSACSKAIVIDGHMKGTRSVCADAKCEKLVSEELGEIYVGCKKTPSLGSYFCKDHNKVTCTGEQHEETANKDDKKAVEKERGSEDIELECRTTKDKVLGNKHKTAGICAAVYNCGIITGVKELYGSESLSQVYLFLVWLVKTMVNFPKLLAYDDACHLKKFVCNPVRCDKTSFAKFIAALIIVVDKMHFCNHVDKWCKRNVNPYTNEAFKYVNTEACEQTFHFISKYKYATKHMSYGRYNIFMLYLSSMYNEDRLIRSHKKCKHV